MKKTVALLLWLQSVFERGSAWQEQHDSVGVRLNLESAMDESAFVKNIASKHPHIPERVHQLVAKAWAKHHSTEHRRLALENGLSEDDKMGLLQIHNEYRNITAKGNTPTHPSATNIEQMLWDDAVASVAQNWAENCHWGHNPERQSDFAGVQDNASFVPTSTYVGENLYVYASNANAGYSQSTLLTGITLFYEEYQHYNYATRECAKGEMCGHYTQLVWDDSRYLGCGAAVCNPIDGLGWNNALFLVCNYHRGGNFPRQPYTSGTQCSECPVDRIVCDDGLCGGCPSPNFYTCGGSTEGDCGGTLTCDSGATNSTPQTTAVPRTTSDPLITAVPQTTSSEPNTTVPPITTLKTTSNATEGESETGGSTRQADACVATMIATLLTLLMFV